MYLPVDHRYFRGASNSMALASTSGGGAKGLKSAASPPETEKGLKSSPSLDAGAKGLSETGRGLGFGTDLDSCHHEARAALGVRDIFAKVAIKPGKPNLFGLDPEGTPVFGLPGNPVSALVSFHQLVQPALARMMGAAARDPRFLPVRLQQSVSKKKGRLNWLRGILSFDPDGGPALNVELVAGQGSHMLSGLALANALVEIPASSDSAGQGETVIAVPLNWNE